MKKSLSVILVVTMLFSLLTVGAFAANKPKTDTLLEKVNEMDEIKVSLKAGTTGLGTSADTFYVKGNSVAYEYTTGFFKVRVLLTDGDAYAYFPSLPFFFVKVNGTGLVNIDVKKIIKTATGLTRGVLHYEKNYEETIDGTKYYVEQYNDGAKVTLKFCYVGDDLKLLRVTDAQTNSVQNTYFESISYDFDDNIVKKPTGLDVTPLLKWLIVAIIGSVLI